MAAEAQKIEELTVPDGGIGDLVMEDDEIEAAYGDDDDGVEEFGDEGIAQFPALTKKMAAMGREGDDVIAHLQTGELVIPAQLLEENPDMKETIFAFLEGQGIEDPQRYVVGSDANSINPDTGAAEFFFKFIKKAIKKVVKGVKKVVKAVVKVVKKVAPIILPIALAFTPLGPIYGAALGSGIGTLIQGGSIKDALKSALISGATGAVFQGFTGSGGFMENVKSGLADPIGRFGQTVSGAQTSLSNVFGGEAARAANAGQPGFFSQYVPTGAESAAGQQMAQDVALETGQNVQATAPDGSTVEMSGAANQPAITPDAAAATATNVGPGGQPLTPDQALAQAQSYNPPSFTESIKGAFTPGDDIGFTEGLKNAFFPGQPTAAQATQLGNQAYTEAYTNAMQLPGMTPQIAATQATSAMNSAASAAAPGFLRTYGPLAALGTGVAAASGAFSPVEAEPLDIAMRDEEGNVITGEDLVAQDPGKYLVGDLGDLVLDPETGQYVPRASSSVGAVNDLTIRAPEYSTYSVPTQFAGNPNTSYLQSSTPGGPFARPYVTAAEGGAIFPRRNGGIMPNEGVPNQDSVRAMLMPGEFVMTTDAVRGLGNGNLDNGIKNMYSVMRNLEARGRATA